MTKVFISYSRKDIDFVRRLAGDLEKAGYDVWWDLTDLQGGDDWPRAIPAAIEASDKFIVVLSPNAAESDWVEKEYTQALSLRKKIIPIMLKRSGIPFALNTINYIDFTGDDYAASLNNLLRVLGYTGEPVVPAPVSFSTLRVLRKFAVPISIGTLILLTVLGMIVFKSSPPPTATSPGLPTTPAVILTRTDTPTAHPTSSSTAALTPTETEPTNTNTPTPTSTSTQTPTPTAVLPQAFSLPICIYADSPNVNVREGPSTSRYPVLGFLESNGTNCPFFNARVSNEEGIWFQIGPNQQFAGRWISARGLASADVGLLPLPICIYDPANPAGLAEVHVLPSQAEDRQGNPLNADGTNCPFFTTRKENEEGMWYRFASNQKEKVEFQQYAGGWIHEDFLVVHTLNLPATTLTPTPLPSQTPTPSDTPTSTPTPSPIPTDTQIPTEIETLTETAAP